VQLKVCNIINTLSLNKRKHVWVLTKAEIELNIFVCEKILRKKRIKRFDAIPIEYSPGQR